MRLKGQNSLISSRWPSTDTIESMMPDSDARSWGSGVIVAFMGGDSVGREPGTDYVVDPV